MIKNDFIAVRNDKANNDLKHIANSATNSNMHIPNIVNPSMNVNSSFIVSLHNLPSIVNSMSVFGGFEDTLARLIESLSITDYDIFVRENMDMMYCEVISSHIDIKDKTDMLYYHADEVMRVIDELFLWKCNQNLNYPNLNFRLAGLGQDTVSVSIHVSGVI